MKNRARTYGEEWPLFDLCHSMKNTQSSKKVILVDRFRSDATLEAVRLAALFPVGGFSAGFSIIDLIHSIPSNIQVSRDQLKDSRRQLQHFNKAPEWRYAKHELKTVFYQLAMLQQAGQSNHQLTPFTLNLTPEFVKKALHSIKKALSTTPSAKLTRLCCRNSQQFPNTGLLLKWFLYLVAIQKDGNAHTYTVESY